MNLTIESKGSSPLYVMNNHSKLHLQFSDSLFISIDSLDAMNNSKTSIFGKDAHSKLLLLLTLVRCLDR